MQYLGQNGNGQQQAIMNRQRIANLRLLQACGQTAYQYVKSRPGRGGTANKMLPRCIGAILSSTSPDHRILQQGNKAVRSYQAVTAKVSRTT
ncbi:MULTISPECIES: hypothetical protein [Rhodomicrobium]|uniref:hypothetical protein n=1 Tax=Rhodomicrobium TaxID=1068 RepID=UPI000F739E56|nr:MULTISPECIES: hypothetical protein [Rhodomicrobium]